MMAQFLPKFNPPRFIGRLGSNLYGKVDEFLSYFESYNQYVINHMGRLQNILQSVTGGSNAPFKSIASASTIRPLQEVQPITGTATITQIEAPDDYTELTLLSINGFSLGSTGNIAADKITMAGEQITLTKNLSSGKWYTLSKGAEFSTHEANVDAHHARLHTLSSVLDHTGVLGNGQHGNRSAEVATHHDASQISNVLSTAMIMARIKLHV